MSRCAPEKVVSARRRFIRGFFLPMSHLSDIARRLRENAFNNLEDIIHEAADASPSESEVILRLLAGKVTKLDREVANEAAEAKAEIEDEMPEARGEGFESAQTLAVEIVERKLEEFSDDVGIEEILKDIRDDIENLKP